MPDAALSADRRARTLDRLERERFDLVVVGGGITGAGIAREAALRGLSVALLEAADFASGTSSRSSKLIHGGLRYLALGDVGLVRETALERKRIHRLAPHLAEPRWMVLPTRSLAGQAKMRAGVATYERLGAVEEADRHESWGKEALAREEPLLDREHFGYAVAYREYRTEDARLVLANLRDAAARGAAALSYAPAVAIEGGGERADAVVAECARSGRRVRVRASAVVNAAGPWVDAARRLEAPEARPRLVLSKGVHVVLPWERLPLRHMVVLPAEDGRSIFAIPHGGVLYVGTTDTPYGRSAERWPGVAREDVAYLLAPLARRLRAEPVRPAEIVAAWAGLRPLVGEPGEKASEISRKDEVWVGPRGVVTIAGGKLTGYRPMARQTVERAAEDAGLRLAPAPEEDPPLPGGDFAGEVGALASALAREAELPDAAAGRLARLYGSEAREVVKRDPAPLVPGTALLAGEVEQAVRCEAAETLEDLLYRRTAAALYLPAAREAAVAPAAERMAALLGWEGERRAREEAAVRARLAADLAFLDEGEAAAGREGAA